jgi:uncharacterized phiE125 gp8 family phage protein
MRIERTTAPVNPAILTTTIEEALRIGSGDDAVTVADYIDSATNDLETDTDRALITQTWTIKLDRFPSSYYDNSIRHYDWQTIFIPKGVNATVTSFTYQDTDDAEQTLALDTDYTISNTGTEARLEPIDGWPSNVLDTENDVITIVYTVGIGDDTADMPGWVRMALSLKVKGLYDDCFDKFEQAYNSAICTRKLYFDYSKNDR